MIFSLSASDSSSFHPFLALPVFWLHQEPRVFLGLLRELVANSHVRLWVNINASAMSAIASTSEVAGRMLKWLSVVFGPRPPAPAVIGAIGSGVNITHKADMARGRSSADNGCVEGTQGQFAR